jgi:flagellar protein FlbC
VEAASKKEDSKRPEPKVSVLDLRRSALSKRDAAKAEGQAEEAGAVKAAEAKAPSGDAGRENIRELTLDAGNPAWDRSKGADDAAAPAPARADFRAMLAERLQDAWNGDIVQSARIILRDGDSGTIRLRLRPESLGSVKIELNLSDNSISGRIVVESDEAKSAFERNMSELADAFKRGGFESASLEVAVGSGSGSGSDGRSAGGAGEGPFYSERLRAAVDSGAEPSTASAAFRRQGSTVDMLA